MEGTFKWPQKAICNGAIFSLGEIIDSGLKINHYGEAEYTVVFKAEPIGFEPRKENESAQE